MLGLEVYTTITHTIQPLKRENPSICSNIEGTTRSEVSQTQREELHALTAMNQLTRFLSLLSMEVLESQGEALQVLVSRSFHFLLLQTAVNCGNKVTQQQQQVEPSSVPASASGMGPLARGGRLRPLV